MMVFEVFYQTMAQLCFTLLGLWWLVLQTKYAEWNGVANRRRLITNISLYFMLPGSMSLMALLSPQLRYLWQAAFLLASAVGAGFTAAVIAKLRTDRVYPLAPALNWIGVALYALVAVGSALALAPGLFDEFGVPPLALTGLLLACVVVLGVVMAWGYFVQERPKPRE